MKTEEIEIIKVKSFLRKLLGLIVYTKLSRNKVMLIENCRSIHTFFMSFAIDVVFVNKNNIIIKLKENLKPFRLCIANVNARHVYEASVGFIKKFNLKTGNDFKKILEARF